MINPKLNNKHDIRRSNILFVHSFFELARVLRRKRIFKNYRCVQFKPDQPIEITGKTKYKFNEEGC